MMTPQPRYLSIFASYRKHILIGLGIGAACALAVFAALMLLGGPVVTHMALAGDALLGSDTQMNITVHNTRLLPAQYSAVLLADGEKADTQTVWLKPGEEQTLTLNAAELSLGKHTVQVGPKSMDITVVHPAHFTVKRLEVQPADITPGDDVTVTAVVSNSGDVKGEFSDRLMMDLVSGQAMKVTVGPGEEQTVSVTLKAVQRGTHTLTLGAQTTMFQAKAPASIQIKSFTLSAQYTEPGKPVTASVILENTGDRSGSYPLQLTCDGAVYNEQSVLVDGNSISTVRVDVSQDKTGNYALLVGDQRQTLQVVQLSRPKTGTVLVKKSSGGVCYMTVDNHYSDKDVIMTLALTSNPKAAVLVVYVRAGEKTGHIKVKNGSYLQFYTVGTDMNKDTRKFMTDPRYGQFDDTMVMKTYKTTTTYYWYYRVTTHFTYYTLTFGDVGGGGDGYSSHSIVDTDYPD